MQNHISAATKGANFRMSTLRRLKPFIPANDIKQAVQALVIPRVEYGSVALCGLPRSTMASLRASINAAARLITGSKRNCCISPDLRALNWLPFEARIHLKIACMTHKALHHNTPRYLAEKLVLSGGNRTTRSSYNLLLKPQRFNKKKTYNCTFSGMAPRIWNTLPPETRQNLSAAFKKKRCESDSLGQIHLNFSHSRVCIC